jgi:predicted DNA-binding transcriptional regulator AlpA
MERLDIRSRETLRQMVKRGSLPEPMRDAGGGCRYWLEDDVSNYIQAQVKQRDARHQQQPEHRAAA